VSISPTIYKQFFSVRKCFEQLFFSYSFGFVIFCQKNIGAKTACKMLVKLTTGHNNMVALSATEIDSTDDLRSIAPKDRNCLFPNEASSLRLHKSYSKSNCLLECTLFYAQKTLIAEKNMSTPCTPWYLPYPDGLVTLCDPWQAIRFYELMFNDIPDEECSYCLPDCINTIYHPVVTALPFKVCDESNLGISQFCSLDNPSLPEPKIWGKQVKAELQIANDSVLANSIMSSERTFTRNPVHFTQMDISPTFCEHLFRTKVL